MSEQSGLSDSAVDVTALQLKRHAILSTALPFPKLDWTYKDAENGNLNLIRDYSESLANSALDWYLEHHKSKKLAAQSLHFIIFLFVALASIPPLLKLGFGNGFQSACQYCGWLNDHAGELALVLLGIAGIAKLWDSNAGYTVDWMRFFTTATQINQELGQFRFNWEKIDLAILKRPQQAGETTTTTTSEATQGESAGGTVTQAGSETKPPSKEQVCQTCGSRRPLEELTPAEDKLRLAETFCAQIFKIVGGEIAVWSDEFKKRYDKATSHTGAREQ